VTVTTHPRSGSSSQHPVGSWKPDALANLLQSKTENTQFRMNRLITLSCPSRLIRTASCQTTLCAFFGCWLTPLRRILVSLSHHPKISPIRRLTVLPRKYALRSHTYGTVGSMRSMRYQWWIYFPRSGPSLSEGTSSSRGQFLYGLGLQSRKLQRPV
jgi:hypothetical protein